MVLEGTEKPAVELDLLDFDEPTESTRPPMSQQKEELNLIQFEEEKVMPIKSTPKSVSKIDMPKNLDEFKALSKKEIEWVEETIKVQSDLVVYQIKTDGKPQSLADAEDSLIDLSLLLEKIGDKTSKWAPKEYKGIKEVGEQKQYVWKNILESYSDEDQKKIKEIIYKIDLISNLPNIKEHDQGKKGWVEDRWIKEKMKGDSYKLFKNFKEQLSVEKNKE